jgi:NADPH:quinone reductase
MQNMTAIAIAEPGGPEVLKPVTLNVPVPRPGEILVRIKAAGVNRPDVLQRQGAYPPPPGAPATPGLEIAGEVVGLGQGVKRYEAGDRVCALVPGGGYAEFAVVHEDNALPLPPGLSFIEAGAIPETFFTVWTNVFDRGRLKEGETLLVHGGSSGIGTTAIMLGKAMGAIVVVTAGSEEKCRACRDLGADVAINYRQEDFAAVCADRNLKPDVILDMVGGDYVAKNLRIAAMHGRIVMIAFQKGSRFEADWSPIMMKRLTFTGSTLRPRSVAEKAEIARALEKNVWPLFGAEQLKPIIYRTFPLKEAAAAHALMETGEHIGKIVLVN